MSNIPNPRRTIAELKELREFSGDANGAQRVAFTKTWVTTRAWLQQKLAGLPVEMHTDAASSLRSTTTRTGTSIGEYARALRRTFEIAPARCCASAHTGTGPEASTAIR